MIMPMNYKQQTKWSVNYVIDVMCTSRSPKIIINEKTHIFLESRRRRKEIYKPKSLKHEIKVSSLCLFLVALNSVHTVR